MLWQIRTSLDLKVSLMIWVVRNAEQTATTTMRTGKVFITDALTWMIWRWEGRIRARRLGLGAGG